MLPCSSSRYASQDSVWSWVVCVSATLSIVVVLGYINSFAVIMPVLLQDFKGTRQSIAWVGSIARGLSCLGAPLVGAFIARFNFRISATVGVITCSISLIATSFTQSVLHILLVHGVLYGLGSSFVFISGVLATTKYFKKQQALALGIFTSGIPIGFLAVGPLSQVLIDKFGWRMMCRIIGGGVGVMLILVLNFNPNVNVESPLKSERMIVKEKEQQNTENVVHQPESTSTCTMITETLRTPAYIIAVATLMCQCFITSNIFVHLVEYCTEVGIPAQQGSNLFIYIGISSLISSIVTGRILDIPAANPFHINQVSAATMAICFLLLPHATQYTHFIIVSVFIGLGYGDFLTTVILLLMTTVKPRLRIMSYPLGEMLVSIGMASGPPFIGFIADMNGSYEPAFYTAGGIMLLATCIPFLQYCIKPWRHITTPTIVAVNQEQNKPMMRDELVQEDQQLTRDLACENIRYLRAPTRDHDNIELTSIENGSPDGKVLLYNEGQ